MQLPTLHSPAGRTLDLDIPIWEMGIATAPCMPLSGCKAYVRLEQTRVLPTLQSSFLKVRSLDRQHR